MPICSKFISKTDLLTTKYEDRLKCIICHKIAHPAFRTKCDHLFCEKCILKWLEEKRTCPDCRSLFPYPVKDEIITRIVEETLTLKCKYNNNRM